MNNLFIAKTLQNLRKNKGNKGFTLLELLVVVVILGVLAAIALPNLLGQVVKGRQAEAQNILGTINRSQQAHRMEFGTFGQLGAYTESAPDTITQTTTPAPVDALPLALQLEFYQMQDTGLIDNQEATVTATAIAKYDNDLLDYHSRVTQDTSSRFTSIICQESIIGAGDAGSDGGGGALVTSCTGASTEVK